MNIIYNEIINISRRKTFKILLFRLCFSMHIFLRNVYQRRLPKTKLFTIFYQTNNQLSNIDTRKVYLAVVKYRKIDSAC